MCLKNTKDGFGFPETGVVGLMNRPIWMLETKLKNSGETGNTLLKWAISLNFLSFIEEIFQTCSKYDTCYM